MEIADIIELINNNQIRDLYIYNWGPHFLSPTSIRATTLNKEIHKISVENYRDNVDQIRKLLNACTTNTSLRALELSYCQLGEESVLLMETIQKHPSLEKINLSKSNLSEQLIGEIIAALQRRSSLIDLDFSNSDLPNEAIIAIAAALEDHPSFEALDLFSNHKLSTSGMEAIAKMIATNRSLKKINLDYCLPNHESAQEMRLLLLKALASNSHSVLKNINLCFPTWSHESVYSEGHEHKKIYYTDIPLSEEEITVFQRIHNQHLGLIHITVYSHQNSLSFDVNKNVVETLMYILNSENLSDEVQEACYVLLGHHYQNKPDSMEFRVAILGLLKISSFDLQNTTIENLMGCKLVNINTALSLLSSLSSSNTLFPSHTPVQDALTKQYPNTTFRLFEHFLCYPTTEDPYYGSLFTQTAKILKQELANIQSTYLERLQAAQQCIERYTQTHKETHDNSTADDQSNSAAYGY